MNTDQIVNEYFIQALEEHKNNIQMFVDIANKVLNKEVLRKSALQHETESANQRFYGKTKFKHDYVRFICSYTYRALTHAQSVLDLSNDLPASLNLTRTLFEMGINVEYIKKNPESRLEEFYKNAAGYMINWLEIIKQKASDPTDRAEILKQQNTVRAIGKPEFANRWSRGSVRDRAKEVGKENVYKAIYTIFSHASHASSAIQLLYRNRISDNIEPSSEHYYQQLVTACIFWSIGVMIENIIQIFHVPDISQETIAKFNEIKRSNSDFIEKELKILEKVGSRL